MSVVLFFRHFFAGDEGDYVSGLQPCLRNVSHTHRQQLWDFIRDCWFFVAERHPEWEHRCLDRTQDLLPRLTTDTVWEYLMQVYRRSGGGNPGRRDPLPPSNPLRTEDVGVPQPPAPRP